ncbi:MAG: hypothetical protein CSB19_00935 [Clostridiales bacterium]|nr:MAG: hypothetical protein CSB19_00935 [Clostridiales bacterium]
MIKKLSPQICNKIAAGEVIERPAAIVKELVENSIDAGATAITIEVEEAGKSLISVGDNGCGIDGADFNLLFERHATSKIDKLEDIYAIDTLGFRGEALASIAAVSRVEIASKTAMATTGNQLQVDGGRCGARNVVAMNKGTTIRVRDLFYNTPVRYKFLASDRKESNAITGVVEKMMLANPAIRFSYRLDGDVIRSSAGNNQLIDVIHDIYGLEATKKMLPISTKRDAITLHGYISKPEFTRGNRRYQMLYVNGRYVESATLQDCINNCYRTLNTINRFPQFVLHLEMAAGEYDINIHPSKIEIKFRNQMAIETLIEDSIKQCFADNTLVPQVNLNKAEAPKRESVEDASKIDDYFKLYNQKMQQSDVYLPNQTVTTTDYCAKEAQRDYAAPTEEAPFNFESEPESIPQQDDLDDFFVDQDVEFVEQTVMEAFVAKRATHYDNLTVVGVLFNTYIICQRDNSAFLIDQHAAHERVLYEQFIADFRESKIESQYLMEPIVYRSDHHTDHYIERMVTDIKRLGIDIEAFGDERWIIRSVPSIKGVPFNEQSIVHILDAIDIYKADAITEHNIENIIMASCKAAVKARDKLSTSEIYALLELLQTYNQPYTCPHGRPIIIELTEYELEKLFKRVQ